MIFETERLFIKSLEESDEALFYDMMHNPKVMDPIPRTTLNAAESKAKLLSLIEAEKTENNRIWAVSKKSNNEFIGLAGFVNNNADGISNELAYMFRETAWGNGHGTEITKGLIQYGFQLLNFDEIRADVNVENVGSVKILNRFLSLEMELFNKKDNCMDRKYKLLKAEWNKF